MLLRAVNNDKLSIDKLTFVHSVYCWSAQPHICCLLTILLWKKKMFCHYVMKSIHDFMTQSQNNKGTAYHRLDQAHCCCLYKSCLPKKKKMAHNHLCIHFGKENSYHSFLS